MRRLLIAALLVCAGASAVNAETLPEGSVKVAEAATSGKADVASKSQSNSRVDISGVKKYVNQKLVITPENIDNPKLPSIWDDAAFKKALEVVIGKDRMRLIYEDWGKTGRFEERPTQDGTIIYTQIGKPHDVLYNSALVFINLGTSPNDPAANAIQVCFRQSIGTNITVTWLASDTKPVVLPRKACDGSMPEMQTLALYNNGVFGGTASRIENAIKAH